MRRLLELGPVDLIASFVFVTSGVMVAQLVLGVFEPAHTMLISALILVGVVLIFVKQAAFRVNARDALMIALLGVLVLLPRWNPFLYVEGGQDQGVYVAMSSHFARTNGIPVFDHVRARLDETERVDYDRLNNRYFDDRVEFRGRSEGEHQPGVFIADLARSSYVFAFYPLHPAWMALTASIFGEERRVYSLVAFSMLAVLMLSLLAYELAGRRAAPAILVALLLAVNPMHVFLSRFPVTENVTTFFSASALYYLLRYFKSRDEPRGGRFYLVLSAGAWSGLFFTHISGFLFAPLFLLLGIAGAASATRTESLKEMVCYQAAIAVAFALSIWYGMTWSFPYTFGIYRQAFGPELATWYVEHWLVVVLAFVAAGIGLTVLAWDFRAMIRLVWSSTRLHRVAVGLLLAACCFALLESAAEGYGLGFTRDYSLQEDLSDPRAISFAAAGENWLQRRAQLSGTGSGGILHSTALALAVYVTPFILAFILVAAFRRRRTVDPYQLFLLYLVSQFLLLRVGLWKLTLYYYYGRYLVAELVPFIIVLAGVWAAEGLRDQRPSRKWLAASTVAAALAWEIACLLPQYPGGEMHRLDADMRSWVQKVGRDDIILLAGINSPTLRTSLDFYYGRRSVVVDASQLPEAVRRYGTNGADTFVFSNLATLQDMQYLGAVSLTRSAYAKNTQWDVLPMDSSSAETRYFLYRANRSELARLREGDVVSFGRDGNEEEYLGLGWSGQEPTMRWSDGTAARLRLPFAPGMSDTALQLEVLAHNCIDVGVLVNGEPRTKWKFADCNNYAVQSVVIRREDVHQGAVDLTFDMPGAKSPHELDASKGDDRRLGISVRRLAVGALPPAGRARQGLPMLRAGDIVSFDAKGNATPYLGGGWSTQEETMRWSDGAAASLRLPLDPSMTGAVLKFELLSHRCIGVGVKVNGESRSQWRFADCNNYTTQAVTLTRDDLARVPVVVTLETPAAKSPREIDPSSEDRRKLGVSVRRILIEPRPR